MKQKKTVGIRTKLIAVIIPIVLVLIVSFFALSGNTIMKLSKDELASQSGTYTKDIEGWVSQILAELQVYKDTIEEGGFADDAAILKYMESSCDKNEAYPIGLYMGDDSGAYLDASGWVPDDDWVLTERDWYVEGKENTELAFGEPYYDSQSGQVCVSAAVRMNYDKAVRVMAADVYLDYVSGLMSDISIGSTGKAFLVTKNSQTILAHPDEEMVDMTLDKEGIDSLYGKVGAALAGEKTGIIEAKGDKGNYFVCLNPIDRTDWYLVTYISKKDVLSELHRLENIMVLIAVVAALLLIIVTLRIMNKVVRPVEKVTHVLSGVSEGDFSQSIEVKGHDEIARMSKNMQMFLVQMRDTISQISKTADWLNKQSEENGKVSASLLDSSKSQSEAMGMLEDRVEILSETAEQIVKQMDELAELIRTTRKEGEQAGEMMRQTEAASDSGRTAMKKIVSGMDGIEETMSSLAEQIQETENATEKVNDMVNLIMEIAEETNLLSLNASIEAARAGESGKGFAVVAEQIGKLAANSGTAADDISHLTEGIKDSVGRATAHMRNSVEEVKNSACMVEEASRTFGTVFEKVGETSEIVGRMVGLVERVDVVAGRMEKIAEDQQEATEAIMQSTEKLGRYTQVVTDNSNTMAEGAKELQGESRNLNQQMNQFKI